MKQILSEIFDSCLSMLNIQITTIVQYNIQYSYRMSYCHMYQVDIF